MSDPSSEENVVAKSKLLGLSICVAVSACNPQTNKTQQPSADSINSTAMVSNVANAPTKPSPSPSPSPVGRLEVKGRLLYFAGAPAKPRVEGSEALDLKKLVSLKDRDLYLVSDTGGDACPAQFRIAEVSALGLRVTDEFGTCSDLIKTTVDGAMIRISMSGFVGPLGGDDDQTDPENEVHTFTYQNGSVEETTRTKPSATTPENP
jgi:hypothetical protein